MQIKDFLDETDYYIDRDIPSHLLNSDYLTVTEMVFVYETERSEGTYPAYEFATQHGSFLVISPNREEWLYYQDIDSFVEEVGEDLFLSYDYEEV